MVRTILGDRAVIRISGEGAEKLLNDTLTGTIEATAGGDGRWFGLLSPQGKVQTEGLVAFRDGAFFFDIDGGTAADFVKRMKLYRLRAKAEIEDISAQCAVVWTDDVAAGSADVAVLAYRDARHAGLGHRMLMDWERAYQAPADERPLFAARIAAGVPELGADFAANDVFPHDIGMDLLGGVDFKKGCYIGQEVVSRMQHRGTARRRPVIVSGVEAPTGTPVLAGEREAGILGTVADGGAVAIVRLDRISDPDAVTAGGKPVRLTLPSWATYAFGESATAE